MERGLRYIVSKNNNNANQGLQKNRNSPIYLL